MGKVVHHKRLSKQSQIGDLRARVTISERKMTPPSKGESSWSQKLIPIATVWAMMETTRGYHIFDGNKRFDGVEINEDNKTVHQFTIRYRNDVVFGQIINYKNINYKIIKVENSESRNRFSYLYCIALGDDSAEVNK